MNENAVRAISLELGPSQLRDKIIVETVDHAKLILEVSYNWEFRFDRTIELEIEKIF